MGNESQNGTYSLTRGKRCGKILLISVIVVSSYADVTKTNQRGIHRHIECGSLLV